MTRRERECVQLSHICEDVYKCICILKTYTHATAMYTPAHPTHTHTTHTLHYTRDSHVHTCPPARARTRTNTCTRGHTLDAHTKGGPCSRHGSLVYIYLLCIGSLVGGMAGVLPSQYRKVPLLKDARRWLWQMLSNRHKIVSRRSKRCADM